MWSSQDLTGPNQRLERPVDAPELRDMSELRYFPLMSRSEPMRPAAQAHR
jgi:hypothetical protein